MNPNNSQFDNYAAWKKDSDDEERANQKVVNDTSISNEQASRKFDRNKREKNTREAYRENTPVSDLEYMAEKGHPTEVSGAAIARIKANKPGKFES